MTWGGGTGFGGGQPVTKGGRKISGTPIIRGRRRKRQHGNEPGRKHRASRRSPEPGQEFIEPVMVTSGSTTAPNDAAEQAGANVPAFFSSGLGPAQQYSFSEAGGVGQVEQSGEEEG